MPIRSACCRRVPVSTRIKMRRPWELGALTLTQRRICAILSITYSVEARFPPSNTLSAIRERGRGLPSGGDKPRGEIPEWPKGTDCKSVAECFRGSNPLLPTIFLRPHSSEAEHFFGKEEVLGPIPSVGWVQYRFPHRRRAYKPSAPPERSIADALAMGPGLCAAFLLKEQEGRQRRFKQLWEKHVLSARSLMSTSAPSAMSTTAKPVSPPPSPACSPPTTAAKPCPTMRSTAPPRRESEASPSTSPTSSTRPTPDTTPTSTAPDTPTTSRT